MPRSQALLEALLALIGDVCLLPYTYMGICHAVQGDAGLDPGHHGVRPGSAGGLHRRVPLPGARVCVPRELGMLWGYFVFSMVFSAFRWRHCKQYGGTAASIPSSGSTQYALSLSHFLSLSFCILAWFLFLSVRSRAVGPPRRATRAHPAVPAAHLPVKRNFGSR